VTVYGVTEETYERVTGTPGSFAAFRRGFEGLLRSGINFGLKATILRSNFRELPAIRSFGEKHAKGDFRIDPILYTRFDGDARRNAMIRAERLTMKEIVEMEQAESRWFVEKRIIDDDLLSPELSHINRVRLFRCNAGDGRFSVGFDGTFRLCALLWAPGTTFDLRKGTLKEAFDTFVPRVRGMCSRNRGFLDTCRKCPRLDFCSWCPAHAHLETGDMDARAPYFCAIAHARAEAISARLKGNP
jgi:radical SAM protein with 4Fe4S-binding SPASM domain